MLSEKEFRRFAKKVRIMPSGCLVWTGSQISTGYGNLKIRNSYRLAHRVAYEHWIGPIPDGLQIDHLCRNRACVNPSHLEAVTQRVNILRGVGATAENAQKLECSNGHPYDGENTYFRPDGRGRECRACMRERNRARYAQARCRQLTAA
ncbi:HNH endonuclease signature motif containing protein [Amycolatopsis jiangsuensis]|uniref:HNH nuclease domain-containing protein n=1 Tax=Amycolatopsis jiangsuensis TaxID=1181879 RepID=A0A840J408_9PSEU|nr:HNH endonuclease signature motif containing protein [Amycolatopsis jiangsuensis]MBB4689801.1 hypothetical protein [Amycolatopsis jiangsuensis]